MSWKSDPPPAKPADKTSAWPTPSFQFVKGFLQPVGSEILVREKQQALRQRSWSDHLPSQVVGTLYA